MKINNIFTQKNIANFLIWIVVLIISYRFLLPFGDEPDFTHAGRQYFMDIFKYSYSVEGSFSCSKWSMPGGFFAAIIPIEPFFCNSSIIDIIYRSVLQIVLTTTLIFLVFFAAQETKTSSLIFVKDRKEKFEILLISILFPTSIYYFGIYSNEQLFVITSFLFFIYYENLIISLLLISFLIFLDIGNALVISFFYLFLTSSNFFIKKTNIFLYIFSILTLMAIIIFQHEFIYLTIGSILQTSYFSWVDYFYVISEWLTRPDMLGRQLHYGVPHYFKPIVTFMSMLFLTPNLLKSYILTIGIIAIFSYSFFKFFLKKYDKKNPENQYLNNFLISVFFIIIVVLFIPSHSWFKYYVFLIPFMMGFICQHIEFKNLFILFVVLNLFTLATIAYGRLQYFFNL